MAALLRRLGPIGGSDDWHRRLGFSIEPGVAGKVQSSGESSSFLGCLARTALATGQLRIAVHAIYDVCLPETSLRLGCIPRPVL
jgi:hypothetical protein